MADGGYVLGVDIGGTFTDLALLDVATAECRFFKTPSTPGHDERAVVEGALAILGLDDRQPGECVSFIHGTTLALNAVLTRTGARPGLLVTEGFGDILEIGRLQMPDPFDFYTTKPEPLIRRRYVAEIPERVLGNGEVLAPLREDDVVSAARALASLGVDVVAVCFLNSYRNPVHEREAARIVRERFPTLPVLLSSEVWPEIREYERSMVTLLNAYVAPAVDRYLASLGESLRDVEFVVPVNVTTSNGGMLPATLVTSRPASTLLSGPAAGMIASARLAEITGEQNVLALDMGGTSSEIAVITGAEIAYSTETRIGDFPVILPSVDVVSVGAGGGSIARLDNLGVLKVGPESAGAEPGPACYGRGGVAPTVTDAYVTTGILAPGNFLGGRIRLDSGLARAAFSRLAAATSHAPEEVAEAVLRIATSNLLAGVARVEALRGIDIRDFTLLAHGGAGPTHACFLAEEVGIGRIVVPPSPGTFCAWGSLLADFRIDFAQTFRRPVTDLDRAALREWYAEREREGTALLLEQAQRVRDTLALCSADMRYRGQGFNVEVPLDRSLIESEDPEGLCAAFHRRYDEVYGTADPSLGVDFVTARLTVLGRTRTRALVSSAATDGDSPAGANEREVFVDGTVRRIPAYSRAGLAAGFRAPGPCIVDEATSTTFVHVGWTVTVDEHSVLCLERAGA